MSRNDWPDEGPDWAQQQDQDAEVAQFMEAVFVVAAYIGDERLKAELFAKAGLPLPVAPEQESIEFDTSHVTY